MANYKIMKGTFLTEIIVNLERKKHSQDQVKA